MPYINKNSIECRRQWVSKIQNSPTDFSAAFAQFKNALTDEIQCENGVSVLLGHLRYAGDIPESYGHDSSEEKLYAKYTDLLLAKTFEAMELRSLILDERGDAADVEVFADDYSFVADAKAFRLSRTAKNQKDFKVQSMARWKGANPYAVVVAPIYQLPLRASQIYEQASRSNVCILTYAHLSVLLRFSEMKGPQQAKKLLHEILRIIETLNPSKDAIAYWTALNRTMLGFSEEISVLWATEKQVSAKSIAFAKQEALDFLSEERKRIMSMSHEQAITELIRAHKVEAKINTVNSVADSGIMEITGALPQ
jgi:type II restriction enzyme